MPTFSCLRSSYSRSSCSRARALAHGLLLLAAILKLFPLFAWGLLLRQPRRWVLAGGGGLLLAFTAYALVILDQIRAIRAAVPQEVQSSYGAAEGVEAFQQFVSQHGVTPLYPLTHPAAETAGQVGVVAAGLLVGLWLARRWNSRDGAVSERDLAAFWAGAGIFCGTRAPIFPLGLGDLWVEVTNWFPFEELVNWLVFAYLAAALIVTRPRRSRPTATQ